MKGCQTIAIELPGYLGRKLDPVSMAAIRAHVQACDSCQAGVKELERLNELLAVGLPTIAPSRTFASSFANRLAAEIAAESAEEAERGQRRWLSWLLQPWLIPVAVAATLAAIVFAPWFAGEPSMRSVPGPSVSTVASSKKPSTDVRIADGGSGRATVAGTNPPEDVIQRPELFVDFAVIRDLDILESNQEVAGRAG
jgi:hypothetical protein